MAYSRREWRKTQSKKHNHIPFILIRNSIAIRKKLEQCNKRNIIVLYEAQSRVSRRKSNNKCIGILKKINVKTAEKQILKEINHIKYISKKIHCLVKFTKKIIYKIMEPQIMTMIQ